MAWLGKDLDKNGQVGDLAGALAVRPQCDPFKMLRAPDKNNSRLSPPHPLSPRLQLISRDENGLKLFYRPTRISNQIIWMALSIVFRRLKST